MPNKIKESGGGLALQVTKPARQAALVEETSEGEAMRLADVVVYGFDSCLLVVDADRVAMADRAELVATLARDMHSIHHGQPTSVEIAGNGYQVQLPGCERTGFRAGDSAPVIARRGMLFIHDGTKRRLASDLAAIREEQVST